MNGSGERAQLLRVENIHIFQRYPSLGYLVVKHYQKINRVDRKHDKAGHVGHKLHKLAGLPGDEQLLAVLLGANIDDIAVKILALNDQEQLAITF